MVNPFCSLSKISSGGHLIVLDELLRISCNKREPGALYLHHYPMAFLESVIDPRHCILEFRGRIWFERFCFLKSVAETHGHRLAAEQHLIAAGLKD